MELSISDDPLAKYADMESPVSGREKGKHNKGRQRRRTVDENGQGPSGRPAAALSSARPRSGPHGGDSVSDKKPSLFAKPSLEEMGRAGDYSKPAGSGFRKPSLDDMGPGTDMPTPAGAISRSLFKKQSAREAHGSDFGIPESGKSLFRKNSLDEMTVRRTEKPVEGKKPVRPDDVKPIVRGRIGAGSYEDPAEASRQKRRPGKTGRPGK
jgi:excinuclease ABC subunit B